MTARLPKDPHIASLMAEAETRQQDRGFMGRFFGSGPEKPGNVVGFTIAAILAIVLVAVAVSPETIPVRELLILAGTALGYLFGKSHHS